MLKEEAAARTEAATKRAAEELAQRQWYLHQNLLAQKTQELHEMKEQEKRQRARETALENLRLAELERQRRLQARQSNTNRPSEDYFKQFNTTTR